MIPLSFAQRRMWILHELEGGSQNWNRPAAFRLTGSLDRAALTAAPEQVSGAVEEALAHRFDLAAEPPLQVRPFRCSPDEHVLAPVIHHITTDGSSGAPLLRDVTEAYNARRDGRDPGEAGRRGVQHVRPDRDGTDKGSWSG
ncbi:condensation domain-containing protein [Streptomyces sp. NPDC059517]|uniref:condensation domain-containing protein n=1 Tax=Streptomyces sp. NPDC059517 TaxID=3346855 RepID=UPI0036873849